jgi:hypothetical protein
MPRDTCAKPLTSSIHGRTLATSSLSTRALSTRWTSLLSHYGFDRRGRAARSGGRASSPRHCHFRAFRGRERLHHRTASLPTRQPRGSVREPHFSRTASGEREGLHYYLRSREEIARGGFLEYTEVHGNLYDTSRSELVLVPAKRTCSSAGTQTARHTQTCSAWLLHASCHRLRPAHLADKARQFRAPHVPLSCRMLFWCGTTASPLQDWAPWLGSRYSRQPGLHHGSPFFRHAKSKLLVYEALSY